MAEQPQKSGLYPETLAGIPPKFANKIRQAEKLFNYTRNGVSLRYPNRK